MEFYANLHTHSTHSDGNLTPEELVIIAKEEGYKALAISDHDTETAYPHLKAACEKHGIDCIFATEFSAQEPIWAHIVAFDYDPEYPAMREYLSAMADKVVYTTKHCFDEAVELGNISGITWQEVLEYNKDIRWLCNNHVFRAMQAKGLVEECEYMAWFMKNFRNQRAKYQPAQKFLDIPELIELIHKAGGIALIAHPSEEHLDRIDEFIAMGIDGIEVWHPDLTEESKKRAYDIAIEKELYISGGSDHSGPCSGLYASFPDEKALKESNTYIEPHSVGTTYEYYMEIKTRKKKRTK